MTRPTASGSSRRGAPETSMKRTLTITALTFLLAASVVLACGANKTDQAAHGCPFGMPGVTKTVTNVDNGAKIVLASANAETVKALQAEMGGCPKAAAEKAKQGGCGDCPMMHTEWTRNVENTDNGVVVLLTSSNASDVKKIQETAASMAKSGCNKGGCDKKKATQTASL
jgi:hypothetical protein